MHTINIHKISVRIADSIVYFKVYFGLMEREEIENDNIVTKPDKSHGGQNHFKIYIMVLL